MSTVEERLNRVETVLASLQSKVADLEKRENWIDHITGSFRDNPEFEEVLRLGRGIRQAHRPGGE